MGKVKYLPIINRSGSCKLEVSDIRMIYKDNRKIRFETNRGTRLTYGKLDNVEQYLGPEFVRCLSGCIINLERIREIGDMTVYFDNGEAVRLSRDAFFKVRRGYNRYLKNLLKEGHDGDDPNEGEDSEKKTIRIYE